MIVNTVFGNTLSIIMYIVLFYSKTVTKLIYGTQKVYLRQAKQFIVARCGLLLIGLVLSKENLNKILSNIMRV